MKPQLRIALTMLGAFFAGTSISHAFSAAQPDDQEYFLIESASLVNGNHGRMTGQFIVNGTVEVDLSDQDDDRPPRIRIEPLKPHELKWILGPDGQGRAFAESMGYETVEHDDFSYPPHR